jgi:anti-sigma28 factor (negative regulator of flagellin synthesis)
MPPSAPQVKGRIDAIRIVFDGDQATFGAANKVSQAPSYEDVRPEKVAAIQSALAAGTYRVPAAAVASKLVDAMLSNGHKPDACASTQRLQVIRVALEQYTGAHTLVDCQNAGRRDAETRSVQSESGT